MFNGIIKYTGKLNRISKKKNNCLIEISSNMRFSKKEIGSSVSCSGACLTLKKYKKGISFFFVSKETLNRTIFKYIKKGDVLNLEKPLRYGERISGHFVQGHVDSTATVAKISIIGKSWVVNFKIPKKYMKHIVMKGSITINGVSLTIAKIIKNGFQISIIPQSLNLTNLIKLKVNDFVNIEFDILGKYIKSFNK
tara:strand:+ start:2066 stop:2650 length:585 start_codon:yes stop_codon:yes gene_type:complete